MDFNLTMKEIEDKQLKIDIEFISNSGHQIGFQNPSEAAKMIINRKNEWRKQKEAEELELDIPKN